MKVRNMLGLGEAVEQEQPVPDFCLPRCRIGLEYEWENTTKFINEDAPHIPPTVAVGVEIAGVNKYFNAHIDHSLRVGGMEFTFKEGYSGSRLLRAVKAMGSCSRALGFTGSYRTSLHCHVDMQDTNFPQDVELLGAVYCVVEPFLYQFVGNMRNVCNYCIPWYKHPQQFEYFLGTIRKTYSPDAINHNTRMVGALKNGKGSKYSGLNCFSLGDFGTVEYRQAPVTMQEDRIILWINLVMRIKEWVVNHPMDLPKFVDYCNHRDPSWFIHDVFQSHYQDVVRLSRNLNSDYWNGLETLYQYVVV